MCGQPPCKFGDVDEFGSEFFSKLINVTEFPDPTFVSGFSFAIGGLLHHPPPAKTSHSDYGEAD
jgi:hypothetical protein